MCPCFRCSPVLLCQSVQLWGQDCMREPFWYWYLSQHKTTKSAVSNKASVRNSASMNNSSELPIYGLLLQTDNPACYTSGLIHYGNFFAPKLQFIWMRKNMRIIHISNLKIENLEILATLNSLNISSPKNFSVMRLLLQMLRLCKLTKWPTTFGKTQETVGIWL